MPDGAAQAGDRVQLVDEGVVPRPGGEQRRSLEQKLELFDRAEHGGEFMAVPPVGREHVLDRAHRVLCEGCASLSSSRPCAVGERAEHTIRFGTQDFHAVSSLRGERR